MTNSFDTILDECLRLLRSGKSIETCLAAYPELSEAATLELRSLLETARYLEHVPELPVSPAAYAAGRERMRQALQQRPTLPAISLSPVLRYAQRIRKTLLVKETWTMKLIVKLILSFVISASLIGTSAVFAASTHSLPGESFYSLKRAGEALRMQLTFNKEDRQLLEYKIEETRKMEINTLTDEGREAELELEGVIQSMDGNTWLVSGLTLQVGAAQVSGEPFVGSRVSVDLRIEEGGTLIALRIEVEEKTDEEETETPEPSETEETEEPELTTSPHPSETPEPTGWSKTEEPDDDDEDGDDDDGDDDDGEEYEHTSTPVVTVEVIPPATSTPEPTETDEPEETEEYREHEETDEPEETDQPEETDEP